MKRNEEENEKQSSSSLATTDQEDEEECCCPICFAAPEDNVSVAGPCGHSLCVACMERILLAKRPPPHSYIPENDPDSHLLATTLGRCPICRAELSLFELKEQRSNENLYKKNYNIHLSPIAGLTYAQVVGSYSLHFPDDKDQQQTEHDSHGRPLPYMSFENVNGDVTLDDGSPPPSRKYFEEGCHFHDKTRTFHGRLVWCKHDTESSRTFHGSRVWEMVLQFSSDLRHVSSGTLVKRRDRPPGVAYPWPLDGKWKVTWESSPGIVACINIQGGVFRLGPFEYTLDTSNPSTPKFTWPMTFHGGDTATLQTATSGVDLEAQPQGPPVGGIVTWTTNDPEYTKIKWERQTIETNPPHKVQLFGPTRGLVYHRVHSDAHRSTSMPSYHSQDLWGNTFIQALKVGLASYHFLSDDNCYICYEHSLCGQWPPLDDGSPIPSQVAFSNITWDLSTKTFHGIIEWEQLYGTTWQGSRRWLYEIRFDSQFTCILSGKVETVLQDDQIHEMSTYGDSLVYINGGIVDLLNHMLSSAAAEDQPQEQDEEQVNNNNASPARYSRFRRVAKDLRRRLESEGVSVRTMAMIQRVFVSTQQPDSVETIDYNL